MRACSRCHRMPGPDTAGRKVSWERVDGPQKIVRKKIKWERISTTLFSWKQLQRAARAWADWEERRLETRWDEIRWDEMGWHGVQRQWDAMRSVQEKLPCAEINEKRSSLFSRDGTRMRCQEILWNFPRLARALLVSLLSLNRVPDIHYSYLFFSSGGITAQGDFGHRALHRCPLQICQALPPRDGEQIVWTISGLLGTWRKTPCSSSQKLTCRGKMFTTFSSDVLEHAVTFFFVGDMFWFCHIHRLELSLPKNRLPKTQWFVIISLFNHDFHHYS